MIRDTQTAEEMIEHLKTQLPVHMPVLLSANEFERGRASMVYELIEQMERLIIMIEEGELPEEEF